MKTTAAGPFDRIYFILESLIKVYFLAFPLFGRVTRLEALQTPDDWPRWPEPER